MSRVIHLFSNSGYLTIGFLLRDVTCPYGLENFLLQVLDQGSLVNTFEKCPPKSIGLLNLIVVLNAQAIISCLDVFDERRRGGAEFQKLLIQLVVPGNLLLHAPVSVHNHLHEVQTEIYRIESCVERRAINRKRHFDTNTRELDRLTRFESGTPLLA